MPKTTRDDVLMTYRWNTDRMVWQWWGKFRLSWVDSGAIRDGDITPRNANLELSYEDTWTESEGEELGYFGGNFS